MIVCHEHRLVFLKTRKTAGTSIEIALTPFCGDSDIVTRISADDEKLRERLGGGGPQNLRIPLKRYRFKDWIRILRGRTAEYRNHMSAVDVARSVGRDVWDSYHKFCVERNPWDRAVSLYYWKTRAMEPRPPVSEYLRQVPRARLSNFHLYSIGGRVAVDRVVPYENLVEGLGAVAQAVGLPGRLRLPRAKAGHRTDRSLYREILGPEDRAFIADVCRREIELLGYSYDSHSFE